MVETGKRITQLCEEKGMSLAELSQKSGVTLSTIKKIVNNHEARTRFVTMEKICKGFGISITDFFKNS